jgi:hypothetical protein
MVRYLHPELVHHIGEMLAGIKEAIVEANRDAPRHTAVGGELQTTSVAGSTYRFTLAENDDWEPGQNTSVEIPLDPADPQHTVMGTILSALNGRIVLVTEIPLPDRLLTRLTLIEATTWLLDKLREALVTIQQQGETPAQMGAKTFGLLPGHEGRGQPSVRIPSFAPNPEQLAAIALGMESERIILAGAPGTGKTATEAALIMEWLQAGKTVLLLAHTNRTLDSAMARLRDFCEQSGLAHFVRDQRMVRLGTPKDLVGDAYRELTLPGIVDQLLGRLPQERDHLQEVQRELESRRTRLEQALPERRSAWRKQREALQKKLTTPRQKRATLEAQEQSWRENRALRLANIPADRRTTQTDQETAQQALQDWTETLSALKEARDACQQALDRASEEEAAFRTHSAASRLLHRLRGITEESLARKVEECRAALLEAEQAVATHEQEHLAVTQAVERAGMRLTALEEEERHLRNEEQQETTQTPRIRELTAQIEEAERAVQQGDAEERAAEEEVEEMRHASRRITERLEEIAAEQRAVAPRVIAEAQLIGATLTALTTSPYLRDRLFDAVVIDEASMVSLVMMLVAVTHATRHVAVVGDPRQLAPIVNVKNEREAPRAVRWLGTDLFAYLQVRLADADAGRNQVVFLSRQSRMLPEIAAVVSRFFYDGRLQNHLDPDRVPLRLSPHPDWSLMLVNTGDQDRGKGKDEDKVCRARRPERGNTGSKFNDCHVECVVQLVQALQPQLLQRESGEPRICVIAPYGAQKTKIRQALQARHLLSAVQVGTVYSVQSVEYPCVIFDLVEGYDVRIGRFLSDYWGHKGVPTKATRLLNVGSSRASDKLIFVANADYIQQCDPRQRHLLTKLVTEVAARWSIDSRELRAERPTSDGSGAL